MKCKRLFNMFIATALACSMLAATVFAAPDTDAEAEAEEKVEKLREKKEKTENEVSSLQTKLADILIKISDLEKQLVAKGEEVIKAQEDLKAAEEKKEKQYADMKLRIKYMYESGDDSVFEMMLNAESMTDMLSKAEYGEKIHKYDRNMLDEYVDTVEKVKELKASLEAEMAALEDMQKEYEAQKDEFNEAIKVKSAEVEDLDGQIAEAIRIAEEERRKKEEEERRKREEEERKAREEEERRAREEESRAGQQNTPPPVYTPTGDESAAQIIVNAAWSQIGVPYVWGGNTPGVGLDCSGLTKWCHAQAGISIPRYSEDQRWGGTVVYDPLPGDICWTPGHVAIYIGGGQMIEAQQPGTTICVSPVRKTNYVRWW